MRASCRALFAAAGEGVVRTLPRRAALPKRKEYSRPLAQLVATGVNSRVNHAKGEAALSRRAAERLIAAGMVELLPGGSRKGRSANDVGGWVTADGPGQAINPLLTGVRVERNALEREMIAAKSDGATPPVAHERRTSGGRNSFSALVLAPSSMLPDPPRLMLHYKRRGVLVSKKDPAGRPCLFDILRNAGVPGSLVACGRLDFNTEGLLLLTNSGPFAHAVTHPSTRLKRTYRVRVSGTMSADKIRALERGLVVDRRRGGSDSADKNGSVRSEEKFPPLKVTVGKRASGNNYWIEVELWEGKYRQIRRSLEHLRLRISRIIRIGFGPYSIEGLEAGEVREVPIKQPLNDLAEDIALDSSSADIRRLAKRVYRKRM